MPQLKNFNPYTYINQKGYTKSIIIIFVILSVLMKIATRLFSLKGWINVPQFDEEIVTTTWFTITANESFGQLSYFWAFFILDYIWAFLLVFLLGFYVYKKATLKNEKPQWFYWGFLIISSIAYILDCIENTSYLISYTYPENIAFYKIITYAITIVYVIVVIMYFSLKDRLAVLRDFISSAWISLLFLVIIGLTLPKAPQVNSIIVDLYYHPFWFVIILLGVYAPIYCITLSHYPAYFLFSSSNNRIGKKNWRMTKSLGFFGIIWYSSDSKREKIDKSKNFIHESSLGFLRRTLGVFFYIALFYMIAYTTDTNFDMPISISSSSLFLLIAALWWLYELKKKKDAWYAYNKAEIQAIDFDNPNAYYVKSKKPSLHKEIRTYIYFLVITIVVHLVLFILLFIFSCQEQCPYTYVTVVFSLICIILQTITYMYYRTFRSVFKYAFFNKNIPAIIDSFIIMRDKSYDGTDTEKKQKILDKFEKNELQNQNSMFQRIAKLRIGSLSFGSLSNNIIFLQTIAYFGFFNAAFLVVINIWPTIALKINTILILLSYFFLFYGIIVIILKHFIYYKSKVDAVKDKEEKLTRKIKKLTLKKVTEIPNIENEAEKTLRLQILTEKLKEIQAELATINTSKEKPISQQRNFLFTLYVSALSLVILNFLARFNEESRSNLFELAQIIETVPDTAIDLKKYASKLPKTRYYIGCYGGGMKANAWTMTVLNALDSNNTLYDKTACLSGASGGTIGLINYSVIKHEIASKERQKEAIQKIGTENILSMDLTHVFGRDWLNHILIPFKDLKGKDRSTGAMRIYANYANPNFTKEKFNSASYRQYWFDMYMKRGKRFPILISNTTDIKGRQGMAVSIKTKNDTVSDILYAGASDILKLSDTTTLSFYNAASTTNRFPLISPAATIKGKGQYNDGGIYENSGLLSAYKLYEAIDKVDSTAKEKTSVFINIVNDKSAYIKSQINTIMIDCKGTKINISNEVSAIFNSVAATEMFPNYIKDKLTLLDTLEKEHVSFKSIYLPHRFDFEDVKAIYGDEIKTLDCVDNIYAIIKANNDEIRNLVKEQKSITNAIIEPEMSRVMAIPAFEFMQSMLKHSSIEKTIQELQ
ncbi:hypothetical protein [uncultured Kordia sp.]|uniref:hypothetical protein n=1 Tax=uncultured Kordia sp. TaxID=507699 RepID=UPI0026120420|nr:hypothetical protein [uncultured Kordia sp.]